MTDNTGDTIGRDKIVHGDVVGQDKVAGDKIVSEQNIYGDLHIHHAPVEPAAPPVDFAAIEQRYREQVVKHYNKLALTGLPERDPGLHEIALEQIFIKLSIELPRPAKQYFIELEGNLAPRGELRVQDKGGSLTEQAKEEMKHEWRRMKAQVRPPEPITLSVAEALRRHPHLTIIGGPGSGKTTLTRWLAVIFARREQAKTENLGAALADERLPIVLELRRFAERFATLGQQPAVPDLAVEIASFISQHAYYPETSADFIQQALKAGRCLILLDGLDEIADLKARQTLSDAVQAFLQHTNQSYRQNLLLVTSRPHGYHSISLSTFQECEIKPFSKEDVASFIRHWYLTAYPDQEQSEAGNLIDAIGANERVGELATNPLLCTIIAIVYRNNRVLPNRRVELYLKCCEALLDTWERNKAIKESGLIGGYDWQTKLELLAPVAYWLHSEAERLAAPEADFVTQLAQVLRTRQLGDPAKAEQTARQFIEVIRDRSGLLQGRGDGTLEFTHRTFQEYLSARHIAAQPYPDYIDWVMVHLHEAWWREVHLLVIGYLGSNSATADRATALLHAILAYIPPPWPWLRSYSLTALTPRWLLRLIEQTEDTNRVVAWGVQAIRMVVLSPYLPFLFVAWWWPRWQLTNRLAWLLDREWAFVALGYLDCTPVGVRPTLSQPLIERAEWVLTRCLYDRAYASDFVEKVGQLLRTLRLAKQEFVLSLTIPLTALHDPEGYARTAAATVLGQVGQADPAVSQALLTALHDSAASVREAAASALGQVGQADPAVSQALLTALHDSAAPVREAAATVLGQVGQADPAVSQALLTALHDPERFVRSAAARALGQMGKADPAVSQALLTALHDPEWFVRSAAARALGQVGQTDPAVSQALLTALQAPEGYVRSAAAAALGQVGQADPTVSQALLTALHAPEEIVRDTAARALGQVGQADPAVSQALLTTLHDPEGIVRDTAARALGQVGQADPAVSQALLTALHDPAAPVREAAASTLGQVGQADPTVSQALLTALHDPEGIVRDAVATALVQVGQADPAVSQAFLTALHDPEKSVRSAAARALGQMGQADPAVSQALLTALHDPEWFVRGAAARALGQVGQTDSAISQALLTALQAPEGYVRSAATTALGQLKVKEKNLLNQLLIGLNRQLHGWDDYQRRNALDVIDKQLEGRPLPGYRWIPIRERIERRRRLNRLRWWAMVVCIVVLAALTFTYLEIRLGPDDPRVQFGVVLAALAGLAAAIAQVLGWTLRSPYEKHEP